MSASLLVATRHGLVVCPPAGDSWQAGEWSLTGQNVTSVIAREGVILAGTKTGVYRSDDLGKTWHAASSGLSQPYVRWMAYQPEVSDFEFAGTEPAGIFISHDGAATWRACPEVAQLRDQYRWFLPYSPEAGCVRGFAFNGDRAYAAVEVGGVLRSDDRGENWRLAAGSSGDPSFSKPRPEGFVHPDVHSIECHPSSPDLVYAPTGGGFYRSNDGGTTWTRYYDCYCRAAWIDPDDPEHIILGPADSVQRNGRIEATRDGGRSWQSASPGLDVPWSRDMVERFVQIGTTLLAVLARGDLLAAPLGTLTWSRILPQLNGVNAVTTMR